MSYKRRVVEISQPVKKKHHYYGQHEKEEFSEVINVIKKRCNKEYERGKSDGLNVAADAIEMIASRLRELGGLNGSTLTIEQVISDAEQSAKELRRSTLQHMING